MNHRANGQPQVKNGNVQFNIPFTHSLQLQQQQEQLERDLEQSAVQIKKSMIKLWKDNLNQRKTAFWNYIKSEKQADIYYEWIECKPTVLPQKFIPKLPKGESMQGHEARICEALRKFKAEHEKLIVRSRNYFQKMESYDQKMLSLISKHCGNDKPLSTKLTQMWNEECEKQEKISQERWITKDAWFKQYKTDFLYDINMKDKEPSRDLNQEPKQVTTNTTKSAKSTYHQCNRRPGPSAIPNHYHNSDNSGPPRRSQSGEGHYSKQGSNYGINTNNKSVPRQGRQPNGKPNNNQQPESITKHQSSYRSYHHKRQDQTKWSHPPRIYNYTEKPHPSDSRTNKPQKDNTERQPQQAKPTVRDANPSPRPMRYADAVRNNANNANSENNTTNSNQNGPFLGQKRHAHRQAYRQSYNKRGTYQTHVNQYKMQ